MNCDLDNDLLEEKLLLPIITTFIQKPQGKKRTESL